MNPIAKKTASYLMAFLMVANDLFALSGLFITPEVPLEIEEIGTEEVFESPEVKSSIDESSEVKRFEADLKYGIVGSGALDPLNSPSDDIFTIELSQDELNSLLEGHAYLKYEMRGVKEGLSIPKGINGSDTYGTMDFTSSDKWSEQLEEIDSKDLWAGKNYIRFTIPSEYRASVEIRELEIISSQETLKSKALKSAKVSSFSSTSGLAELSGAKLFDGEKAIQKGKVTALFTYETPSIPGDIINVTEGATAYRIESPSEDTDLLIRIPLDESKIPAGYTKRDVKTYYFDYDHKRWQELPRYMDEGGEGEGDGSGLTTAYQGGTDYINGVIQAPEMPAASAFVPTSLSDIKAANPSAGMTIIQPPTINQQGTASIQFPITIPKGRNGMQPNISLSYSSEGGESWVGYGWSVNIPSITVDTRWGVPEFNSSGESESYLLNGEQLIQISVPPTGPSPDYGYQSHRPYFNNSNLVTGWIDRMTDARFARKVTSGYENIVREGSSTTGYTWKVTSADGTIYTYGSDANSRVLASGNHITEWKLRMVEDKWGNQIKYTYTNVTTSSSNQILDGGTQKVISRIEYTGFNDANFKYHIDFVRSTSPTVRQDARVSYRKGFKETDGALLDYINVMYNGSTIVTQYDLVHGTGDFFKTILEEVKVLKYDGSMKEFYKHTFEYYELGSTGDIFNTGTTPDNTISTPSGAAAYMDDYQAPGWLSTINEKDYVKGYSPLGSSASTGGSVGVRIGIGANFSVLPEIFPTKLASVGGYLNLNFGRGKGRRMLSDMNGDGLPDLVFQNSSDLISYFPMRESSSGFVFSDTARTLTGIKKYYSTKNNGKGWGVETSLPGLGASTYFSKNYSKSEVVTRNYICDYNSDGVVDLVDESSGSPKVYFGRIESGDLVFKASSKDAPNPVFQGEAITQPTEDDEYEFPTEIAKIWEAPFGGDITVTGGNVSLGSGGDGIRFSIQKNGSFEKTSTAVSAGSSESGNLSGTLTVSAGDLLIFRVYAKDNAEFDYTTWDPQITYQSAPDAYEDPNGIDYGTTSASDGFLLSSKQGMPCLYSGTHYFDFDGFTITDLSDDIEFKVTIQESYANGSSPTTVSNGEYSYTYSANTTKTITPSDLKNALNQSLSSFSATINDTKVTSLKFEVITHSNVDWQEIDWRPLVYYIDGTTGNDHVYKPVVDLQVYNKVIKMESDIVPINLNYYFVGSDINSGICNNTFIQPCLTASPSSFGNTSSGDKAYFVVKRNNELVGKVLVEFNGTSFVYKDVNTGTTVSTCTYSNVTCPDMPTIHCSDFLSNERLYVEYFTDSEGFATDLASYGGYMVTAYEGDDLPYKPTECWENVNVFLKDGNDKFGPAYLGWGQFAWSDVYTNPLSVSNLTINEVTLPGSSTFNSYDSESELETAAASGNFDLETIPFQPLVPKRKDVVNVTGSGGSTNLSVTTATSHWVHYDDNIYVDDSGFYPGIFGGIGSDSESNSLTWSSDDYTADGIRKLSRSRSESYSFKPSGLTYGGLSISTTSKTTTKQDVTKVYSEQVSDFIDIDGDGYLDAYIDEGSLKVQYTDVYGGHKSTVTLGSGQSPVSRSYPNNTSYGKPGSAPGLGLGPGGIGNPISNLEGIGSAVGLAAMGIKSGNSNTESTNEVPLLSPPNVSGQFSFGSNKSMEQLLDINGDGLTDRVIDGGSLTVKFSNGESFESSSAAITGDLGFTHEISKGASESSNEGIGLGGRIWAENSWSAGFSHSHSWNGAEVMFIDINGDGLVDQLSPGDNEVKLFINTGSKFVQSNVPFGHVLEYMSESVTAAGSKNGAATVSIPLGPVKMPISVEASGTSNLDRTHLMFSDVNGDGFIDILKAQEPDPSGTGSTMGTIDAWHSNIGKSNKLKKVTNPLGGSFTIDYDVMGKKYKEDATSGFNSSASFLPSTVYWDMPNSRWVMSEVVVNDGYDLKNGSTSVDGEDLYTTTFDYEGGVYSRRDRQFLGFTRTKTVHPGEDRASFVLYHEPTSAKFEDMIKYQFILSLPFKSYEAILVSANTYDVAQESVSTYEFRRVGSDGKRLSGALPTGATAWTNYEPAAIFPQLNQQSIEVDHTIGTGSEIHKRKYTFTYDDFFNVIKFENEGINGGSQDITTDITYWTSLTSGITNMPKQTWVYDGNTGSQTNYLRKTEVTTLHASKAPKIIRRYVVGASDAYTDLAYDGYGNLTQVKGPDATGRPYTNIAYETTLHTYPISYTNNFSEVAEMNYDLATGNLNWSEDVNNERINYYYDEFDRLEKVKGPDDPVYSIKFQYMPSGKNGGSSNINETVPVAVTYHFQDEGESGSSYYSSTHSLPLGSSVESYNHNSSYDVWTAATASTTKNSLQTATFVDGLGRVVQIKKDITYWNGSAYSERRAISFTPEYDAYGRVIGEFRGGKENSSSSLLTYVPRSLSAVETEFAYDKLNRRKTIKTPDDGTGLVSTTFNYSYVTTGGITDGFQIKTTDPNGKVSKVVTDNFGRKRLQMTKPSSSDLVTKFNYDAIGQLTSSVSPDNKTTSYVYDEFGRLEQRTHPDAGTTKYTYNAGSGITNVETANLTSTTTIDYTYSFGRLTAIDYPDTPTLNDVRYTYGTTNNSVGRISEIELGSNGSEVLTDIMKYDNLGNVVETERTIWVPTQDDINFTTEYDYDSWGRMITITYPDQETVRYHYGYGGEVHKVYGTLSSTTNIYVDKVGYDEFGNRTYLKYGNGTETDFTYDSNSLRLKDLVLTGDGSVTFLDKTYTYYDNGNVSDVSNTAGYVSYTYNDMGGEYDHSYTYDGANRLTFAEGSWTGVTGLEEYDLTMAYNSVGGITTKTQNHISSIYTSPETDYNYSYTYNTSQPHTLYKVTNGSNSMEFTYDANGNMTEVDNKVGSTVVSTETLFWNESNQLQADHNLGGLHHFMYDASGERYLKGTLLFDEVDVDGTPINGTDVTTSDYTVYVNPYLVYNSKFENQYGYSKHYYIGSERVASAIGNGSVNSNSNPVVGPGTESLTVHPIWNVLNGYLSDLSITIGSYIGYESTSTTTPLYEEPNDCKKLLKNDQEEVNNCLCTYFPATAAADGINCDNYTPIYWYHPDYLGNTEFVTDILGRPYQHFFYSPFGEELVEQEPYYGNYYSPYHFNAKEVDPETGYHYYGARYYNSNLSVWLSVDPMAKERSWLTPYNFVQNNPILRIDPDGRLDGGPGDPNNEVTDTYCMEAVTVTDTYTNPFQSRTDNTNTLPTVDRSFGVSEPQNTRPQTSLSGNPVYGQASQQYFEVAHSDNAGDGIVLFELGDLASDYFDYSVVIAIQILSMLTPDLPEKDNGEVNYTGDSIIVYWPSSISGGGDSVPMVRGYISGSGNGVGTEGRAAESQDTLMFPATEAAINILRAN